jgi:ABC-type sugar transport system ATPase subunit
LHIFRLPGDCQNDATRFGGLSSREIAVSNLPGLGDKLIDISVSAGEIVGLYGVVGSGCETIGRAAVGLADIRPSTMRLMGNIYRPGSPANAARAGVSYLPSGRAANCVMNS